MQSTGNDNPYAPPQSHVSDRGHDGRLMPYQKAGRVIRLMALLGLTGVLAVGAAIVLPALADRQMPPSGFVLVIVLLLALVTGLSFLGKAVIGHKPWARVPGIIFGVISLAGFPIGTLVGVYVVWQLIFGWKEDDTYA